MRARKSKPRKAARQPSHGADSKPVSEIAAIFAIAFMRSLGRAAAVVFAPPSKPANSLGNCLDDRRPVEASCERVEGAAVNAAESRCAEEALW